MLSVSKDSVDLGEGLAGFLFSDFQATLGSMTCQWAAFEPGHKVAFEKVRMMQILSCSVVLCVFFAHYAHPLDRA